MLSLVNIVSFSVTPETFTEMYLCFFNLKLSLKYNNFFLIFDKIFRRE